MYYGARNCMLPNKCVRYRERCPLYSGRIVQSWHFETYRAVHNIEVFAGIFGLEIVLGLVSLKAGFH